MRPLLIAGPTASGKSALALAVAERDGGVVINADALQVYGCWRVLTARPDAEACRRAPHRLYGHVACDAAYSVGVWLREVGPAIDAARTTGARPVIVGGTGLYLSALTAGLAAIPAISPEVRRRSATLLGSNGIEALVEDLARSDPVTLAQIDRVNPMRVQRAWEVLAATGRGLAAWHRDRTTPILGENEVVRVILLPEISHLNNILRHRFKAMLEDGALEECGRFLAAGGDLGHPSGRALGAVQLVAHLEGRMSLEAATQAAVTATRRYAKRQRTWFRNRMAEWDTIDPAAGDALGTIPRT